MFLAQNGSISHFSEKGDSSQHGLGTWACIMAMFHCHTSTRLEIWPCARPCLPCRMLRTSHFQVVKLTTKATTLVTIKILNYNNYNSYFKHSNKPHLITTLATKVMPQTPYSQLLQILTYITTTLVIFISFSM